MLIPTKENIQKLFETHQNQCAIEHCDKKIIDEDGSLYGNILFIESNTKGKPRFNPDLTNEQMIDYHNLILVCYGHAFDIEWKEKQYTIPKIRQEIRLDKKYLQKNNFIFSTEMFEEILTHFIEHHDPDRMSHVQFSSALFDGDPYIPGIGNDWWEVTRRRHTLNLLEILQVRNLKLLIQKEN